MEAADWSNQKYPTKMFICTRQMYIQKKKQINYFFIQIFQSC